MNDRDVWFLAFCAAMAGGHGTRYAEEMADIALLKYHDDGFTDDGEEETDEGGA